MILDQLDLPVVHIDDKSDWHGADTGNWILATAFEWQEVNYGNAGTHTDS